MVSLPDDLLRYVDAEAKRRGTTRSGLLQQFAEESRRQGSDQRARRMKEIDQLYGGLTGHGGNAVELVKANRPRWPKD